MTYKRREVRDLPFPVPAPLPDRGKWLTADDVRAMLSNKVSRDWVYSHVPHKIRITRRMVGWYEYDVRAWLEELRNE